MDSSKLTLFKPWVEAQPQLGNLSHDDGKDALLELVKQYFPEAEEFSHDYHVTLLYIGGQPSTIITSNSVEKILVGRPQQATGAQYALDYGSKDENLIILRFRSPMLSTLHTRLRQELEAHEIDPEHQYYGEGYVPHITLAKYKNKEDAQRAVNQDFNGITFLSEFRNLAANSLVINNFGLYEDFKDGRGKQLIGGIMN